MQVNEVLLLHPSVLYLDTVKQLDFSQELPAEESAQK